jgi:CDP-diacylglycerol--glycerol-3-phosphate 3-phosphatidyltransferase
MFGSTGPQNGIKAKSPANYPDVVITYCPRFGDGGRDFRANGNYPNAVNLNGIAITSIAPAAIIRKVERGERFLDLKRAVWPPTWPMALTLLRLALVPVFLAVLATGQSDAHRWTTLVIFAVMALTDMLDGYLARRLHQTTQLGTLLDPTADKLLVTGALILLCFPRFAPAGFAIPWPILLGIYIKDLGVVIGVLTVRHLLHKVEIKASPSGKLSTVVQLTLIIATLLAPDMIRVSPLFAADVLWALWWATVITAAAAGMGYAREGARQFRAATSADARVESAHHP